MGNFDFQAIKRLDKIILYSLWAVTIIVLSIIFYQAWQQKYNNYIFIVVGKKWIPFDLKRTNEPARCTSFGILDIWEWNVKEVDSLVNEPS